MVGCGPEANSAPVDCEAAVAPLLDVPSGFWVYAAYPFGDGAVVELRPGERPAVFEVTTLDPPNHHRIVAVDGCGERPRTLTEQADRVAPPPRDDLPWVVTLGEDAEEPGLWLFDPIHRRPPRRIGDRPEAILAGWGPNGVLVGRPDAADEAFELVEVVMDAAGRVTETVLHADLERAALLPYLGMRAMVPVVTRANELRVIDLETRTVEFVRSDVNHLHADADARFLVFRGTDPEGRLTQYRVLDRERGLELPLGTPESSPSYFSFDLDNGMITASETAGARTHVVLVPEMREFWWPGEWPLGSSTARSDDGTRLISRRDGFFRIAPGSDSRDPIADGSGGVLFIDGRFQLLQHRFSIDPDVDPVSADAGAMNVLELEPHDANPSSVFGQHVHPVVRLPDGRWAYLPAVDDDAVGDLHLFDPASGTMRFVASNVVLSRSLHKSFGSGALISGRNTLLFLDASAEGALWRVAPERLDGIGLE